MVDPARNVRLDGRRDQLVSLQELNVVFHSLLEARLSRQRGEADRGGGGISPTHSLNGLKSMRSAETPRFCLILAWISLFTNVTIPQSTAVSATSAGQSHQHTGMLDQENCVRPEQLLRDDQRPQTLGRIPARIADDVCVTQGYPEGLGGVDTRVHACYWDARGSASCSSAG